MNGFFFSCETFNGGCEIGNRIGRSIQPIRGASLQNRGWYAYMQPGERVVVDLTYYLIVDAAAMTGHCFFTGRYYCLFY